ncbi:MAG TPA: hypothetical protein EYN67_14795 [Flavobacteriales bacterium]|nr:hypothetical protein [Flavobacteriales bacterium]
MPVRSYEPLSLNSDVTTTRTFLHEVLPITGSIISGTYGKFMAEDNIKNYTHGMFQSVYDYPYLSSSTNHIFDITCGYDESTVPLSSSAHIQNAKKINMYNQFCQVLLGFTGSNNTVRMFENDLKLDKTGSMNSVYIVSFSRLLTKDQIKKNSFKLTIGTGSWASPFTVVGGAGAGDAAVKVLQDANARVDGQGVNTTLGGDYGVLYSSSNPSTTDVGVGVVFYQAGIAVITSSAFEKKKAGVFTPIADFAATYAAGGPGSSSNLTTTEALAQMSISGNCDAIRHRIQNITFNNSTEINSTIYFCRVPHNKFNYSANPTYLTGSKIRVKNVGGDTPISYITTVGLYNASNELLAVAKLSEPLKKTPENELTIRVRLDY